MTGQLPFAYVRFDGRRLHAGTEGPGRRLRVDARCLAGEPVQALANVCALPQADAALRFDEPEVQQARRDAIAWWIGLLGDDLVCLSTFALDASRCAGAVTVARNADRFGDDPFARLFWWNRRPDGCVQSGPSAAGPGDRALRRSAVARWLVRRRACMRLGQADL